MSNLISIVCHKLLHQDSNRKLVEQTLIEMFPFEIGDYEQRFANELYNFLVRTGHRENIIMSKESLLDYFKGHDTQIYESLSFILEKVNDKDKVEITTERWF